MSNQEGRGREFVKKSGATADLAEERRDEFEAATAEATFTKDFNASLEAVMHDPLEVINTRVFAWIKRMSWGNNCLYCVKSPNGEPAFQVDCSKELKKPDGEPVDKRRVSAAVSYLVRRGYLEMRGTAKLLYPVLAPVLTKPEPKSEEYRTFIQEWKLSHSTDNQALEDARATVKRIVKVRLGMFKMWTTSRTNETCYKEERLERLTTAASSPDPGLPEEPAAAAPTPEPEEVRIQAALSQYGPADRASARRLIQRSRSHFADATVEEMEQNIHRNGPNARNKNRPVGFLIDVVSNSFEGYVRPKPTPPEREERSRPRCPKCDGYGTINFQFHQFDTEFEVALKNGVQLCECEDGQAIRKVYATILSP